MWRLEEYCNFTGGPEFTSTPNTLNQNFTGSQLQNRAEIGVGSAGLYCNAGQDEYKSVNRTLLFHTVLYCIVLYCIVFEIQSTPRTRFSRFFFETSIWVNFDELYLGNSKRHGKVVCQAIAELE